MTWPKIKLVGKEKMDENQRNTHPLHKKKEKGVLMLTAYKSVGRVIRILLIAFTFSLKDEVISCSGNEGLKEAGYGRERREVKV